MKRFEKLFLLSVTLLSIISLTSCERVAPNYAGVLM